MKTYSLDLRTRVLNACDENQGRRQEIAQRFGVSTAWIRRLLQRRRETGNIEPLKRGGRRPAKFSGAKLEKLKTWVEAQPDITLKELLERSGVDASQMSVHRALIRLKARLKKSPSGPRSKTGRRSRPPGQLGESR
jgi:transposase